MDRQTSFNPSPLRLFKDFLRSVQDLAGLPICVHDVAGFTRGEAEPMEEALCIHYSEFCQIVKTSPKGIDACIHSDAKIADAKAGRLGRPFLHQCHAGLTEMVVPIMRDEQHLGTIFCGQAVIRNSRESRFRTIARNVADLDVDIEKLRLAFRKVPKISKRKLENAGNLLSIAANYIVDANRKMAIQRAIEEEQNRPVALVMQLIDIRFREDLTLGEVAEHVGLSPSYFSRLFRRTTGMTFVEFLTMRRIEEARNLLLTTSMKVIDIAYHVGYADQSYFNKKFRELVGLTPLEFRRQNTTSK
ncbi:MAG: AraC family transcriptional regulator [Planctomycetes bacterium]|nr:AraC family transcriptional regulator [Planctomycetota bacterium]